MGQAKQRGSREDRIAEAKERRQEVPIAEVRQIMGLPEDSAFLGYVVNVRDTDEYLSVQDDDGQVIRRGYVLSPEHALRYASRGEAEVVAASLPKPSVSGLLFDLGTQFFVAFDS